MGRIIKRRKKLIGELVVVSGGLVSSCTKTRQQGKGIGWSVREGQRAKFFDNHC